MTNQVTVLKITQHRVQVTEHAYGAVKMEQEERSLKRKGEMGQQIVTQSECTNMIVTAV